MLSNFGQVVAVNFGTWVERIYLGWYDTSMIKNYDAVANATSDLPFHTNLLPSTSSLIQYRNSQIDSVASRNLLSFSYTSFNEQNITLGTTIAED